MWHSQSWLCSDERPSKIIARIALLLAYCLTPLRDRTLLMQDAHPRVAVLLEKQ
jgi:hypothetical protein